MDDDQALRDAHRAANELTMTDRAFAALRHAMIEELVGSPVSAVQLREKLYLGVQVLDGVRKALLDAVSAGDVVNYRSTLAEHLSLRPN